MSWFSFHKERESLTYGSEMYKSTIIRFLQTQGYHFKSTSAHEGHLADLIMEKENNPDIWVEVKATEISVFEKRMKKEICQYLCEWFALPESERFRLMIFAHKFSRKEDSKAILTNTAKDANIYDWIQDIDDIGLSENQKSMIRTVSKEKLIPFFKSTNIREVHGYLLDKITIKREQKLRKAPNYRAKQLLEETISRRKPIFKNSIITIAFMELRYPDLIWEVESKYKLKKTIYEKLYEKGYTRSPEFTIPRFEDEIPVLRTLDPNFEPFLPYIKGEPYQRYFTTLDEQRKREFLYAHLRRWLWCKGLRRSGSDYYFPYEDLNIKLGRQGNPPLRITGIKGEKIVTKPRFKEGETFNFVEHRSVKIRISTINEKWGIMLRPRFIFTEDGVRKIEGDRASNLYKRYINPEWTRNLNIRGELRFWNSFLLEKIYTRDPDIWFTDFGLKPMLEEKIGWTSESIPKDQRSLELFIEEE